MIEQRVGGDNLLLRLTVYERATRAVLWSFLEPVDSAFREATFVRNLETAATIITNDLQTLAAGQLPAA